MIKNKKAQIGTFNIFYIMTIFFVFILFSAGVIYFTGKLNEIFKSVGEIHDAQPKKNITFPCLDNQNETCGGTFSPNLTEAANIVWGNVYNSTTALRMVTLVYMLSLAACFIITSFLERKYPFLFFAYILIFLLGLILSPVVSNSYEKILNSNIYEGELLNFGATNFIMLNLPLFILVIGALSSIGLFLNLIRGGNENEL